MIMQYLSACLWSTVDIRMLSRIRESYWTQRLRIRLPGDLSLSLESQRLCLDGPGPLLSLLLDLGTAMVSLDMPGLDQPWKWEGIWANHCVPNEEIRQKTQSVSGVGVPMISLVNSSSYLFVCFYVVSQGAYSKAEPFFHDVDIAAHLWSRQIFPFVSSTDIPAGIIGSKGPCTGFFYKTVNIFRINTQQSKWMRETDTGDIDLDKFWKRVQLTPLSLELTHEAWTLGKSH